MLFQDISAHHNVVATKWAKAGVYGQEFPTPTPILSRNELVAAYHRGREKGATHMLIVWDTYDIRDSYNYVVYCDPSEDVNAVIQNNTGAGYSRVSAVFAMHLDIEEQLQERYPWHTEYPQ